MKQRLSKENRQEYRRVEGSLSQRAYACIKAAIIECLLPPGIGISQPELEDQFGLGKAAIRTALTRLQQEGLIEAVPRQGYIVLPVTVRDIEDLFMFRLMVEPAAVQMATPNLTRDDFEILEKTMNVGYDPNDLESQRTFIVANHTFHYTIAAKAGNTNLLKTYDKILQDSARIYFLIMGMRDLSGSWVAGHCAIYNALVNGSGEEAARILRRETEAGLSDIANAVMRSPAISNLNIIPIRNT